MVALGNAVTRRVNKPGRRSKSTVEKYCDKHKDEKLRFYCTSCSKVICRDCKLTDVEGHKTKDIADVVEKARTSSAKTKVELEKFKARIEKSIDHIDDNNTETSKHINDVKEEINKLADSLVEMINTERRKEIDRVADIQQSHGKKCSDEQYRLKQRKYFLQSQIDHTDDMLKDGLDCDVLAADSEMKQRLAEIQKEQQSDSDPGVLDVVRFAVRNVMTLTFPMASKTNLSYNFKGRIDTAYPCESVRSITCTKNQTVLFTYSKESNHFLCLFDTSSREVISKFEFNLDELINEGDHGVIEKYNRESKDNKIPANDHTDLKKPFPYKDTNDNGDTCCVIKEHNWVGIQTVSGDVRTLTFDPFAEPGQFRPVDVYWGNNQEIFIADSDANMIILCSLQHG
ncbi:uncharacterized protein LOC121366553 [Gigantopelta aegis]|uniref:uncharacterized protein LOC121366553 n=1 Tax=Gigantopelta aegis TaxID=1735272 RepID=UPI001B888361|nr:uncharacterized protein LOC121366553 [Gigantopelta aegis]